MMLLVYSCAIVSDLSVQGPSWRRMISSIGVRLSRQSLRSWSSLCIPMIALIVGMGVHMKGMFLFVAVLVILD